MTPPAPPPGGFGALCKFILLLTTVALDSDALRPHLEEVVIRHGGLLLEAHKRVREAAQMKELRRRVGPQLPPDVFWLYVYLPVAK